MLWVCLSSKGPGKLVSIYGIMDSIMYQDIEWKSDCLCQDVVTWSLLNIPATQMIQNMHSNPHKKSSLSTESSFDKSILVSWPKTHWKPGVSRPGESTREYFGPWRIDSGQRSVLDSLLFVPQSHRLYMKRLGAVMLAKEGGKYEMQTIVVTSRFVKNILISYILYILRTRGRIFLGLFLHHYA